MIFKGAGIVDYGKRIRELRSQRDITGAELARRVGLDSSQISKIENGASKPSLDALERICEALNLTLAEFFSGQQDTSVTTRAAHLADGVEELPPEAEKELAQLMDYLRHKYSKKQ